MQFGFMTEPQAGGSYDDLAGLAQWAERSGFDAFARSDHYLNMETSAPATDALTTLGGLARDTTDINLTVMVTPATFRHPAVLAKTAATIDQMSDGRLELGVGTGWMESEHARFGMTLPPMRERFSRLFETLTYLHICFGRRSGGYDGRHYHLSDMEVLPRPTGKLPIIVGGTGARRTPALAGRFADEYNLFSTDLETLAARKSAMERAAREVGRDPDEIRISLIGYPVVGEDRHEYHEQLARRAAARDMEPDDYEAMLEARSALRGTHDQAREQLDELAAAGVGRYYFQIYAPLREIDTADAERILRALSG